MSTIGVDSQDDFSVTKSVQICEDPNSKAHLDSLFDVLNNSQPPVNEGKKQLEPVPMIKRNFPDSFFNPSKDKGGIRRLGPSISVGTTPGFGVQHNRSVSMPASFNDAHPRQFSLDSSVHGPIPPGWEESQTPDGLSYFIDHNTKTTTWEDPRKVMSHMPRGAPLQSHHLPMPPYPQPTPRMQQPIPHQQNNGSSQSVDSVPLPEGWQKAFTAEGETYYVNHKNRTTSWFHPALPQHHHSHSFAGVPRVGHGFPAYPPHTGGLGGVCQDMQRLPYEAHQRDHILQQQQQQHQQQHNLMEAGRAPGALYSDPYLSSNNHIRQASHDSGLGVTAMPYQDVGMDFEEGMETAHSSVNKVTLNQEYMANTDIDTDALQTDPQMQEQMERDLLGGRWV